MIQIPPPLFAVPAKAGTHRAANEAVDKWVPAFAGNAVVNSKPMRPTPEGEPR